MTAGGESERIAACRLLCGVIGDRPAGDARATAKPATEDRWRTAYAIAAANSLEPLLVRALSDRNIAPPACIAPDLRRAHLHAAAREEHLRPLRTLALRAVTGQGIPALVVRGAWLAAHAYPSPALRPSSDLDIVVRRSDLSRAARSLRRAGFLRQSCDLSVDLHSDASTIPGEDYRHVWDRTVECEVDGVRVLAPSVADHLVHICRHAAAHHVMRFGAVRSLCDVFFMLHRPGAGLDWDTVRRVARETRAAHASSVVLGLAREYLGAALPEGVADALATSDATPDMAAQAEAAMVEEPEEGASLSPVFWSLAGGAGRLSTGALTGGIAGLLRRPWPYLAATVGFAFGDTRLRQRLTSHRQVQRLAEALRAR